MVQSSEEKSRAVIGLGSNLEPRMVMLQKALDLWHSDERAELLAVGQVYETEPVSKPGFTFYNDFLNTCMAIDTKLPAHELIGVCKEIESHCGRDFEREFELGEGDRAMDCDLIFYADENIGSDGLVVPHLKWQERNFVLLPLYDIRDFLTESQKGLLFGAIGNLKKSELIPPYGKLKIPQTET